MRLSLLTGLAIFGGCATTQPLMSQGQAKRFEDVVRAAEAAGASAEPPAAAEHLRNAKSEFEYAQHLPREPDHARQLLVQAQADADLALTLAQRYLQELGDARATERQEARADQATPLPSVAP
jgi:hypothetical protein